MPQTREHLAILDLLGIGRGLVALTKIDLVDEEWLDLVQEEIGGDPAGARPWRGRRSSPSPPCGARGLDDLTRALEQPPGRDAPPA